MLQPGASLALAWGQPVLYYANGHHRQPFYLSEFGKIGFPWDLKTNTYTYIFFLNLVEEEEKAAAATAASRGADLGCRVHTLLSAFL